MMPRRLRIPRSGFTPPQDARRASSPHLSVVSFPAAAGQDGVAAVIAKKSAPKSTDRHAAKRRILAVARAWYAPGRAFIVHARPGVASLSFSELKAELAGLYARIGGR